MIQMPSCLDLPTQFIEIDKQENLSAEAKQNAKLEAETFPEAPANIHCISQLLRAYSLYERDKEYVVQAGKVNIVDPNTGRVMPGRRWSALHQAVEAKENCTIEKGLRLMPRLRFRTIFGCMIS